MFLLILQYVIMITWTCTLIYTHNKLLKSLGKLSEALESQEAYENPHDDCNTRIPTKITADGKEYYYTG
jgi:hypothetical protein